MTDFRTLLIGTMIVGLSTGAAFGGGMAVGRKGVPAVSAAPAARGVEAALAGQEGPSGRGGTFGTIEQIAGNRLTLRTPGGQVTVVLPPGVTVRKTVGGSIGDLAVGQAISASGERAADGTVTAQAVQLLPEGAAGAGFGADHGGQAGDQWRGQDNRPGRGAGGQPGH